MCMVEGRMKTTFPQWRRGMRLPLPCIEYGWWVRSRSLDNTLALVDYAGRSWYRFDQESEKFKVFFRLTYILNNCVNHMNLLMITF